MPVGRGRRAGHLSIGRRGTCPLPSIRCLTVNSYVVSVRNCIVVGEKVAIMTIISDGAPKPSAGGTGYAKPAYHVSSMA